MSLAEAASKRRGLVPPSSAKESKLDRLVKDKENQNPNLSTPLKYKAKLKVAIKSSTEKKQFESILSKDEKQKLRNPDKEQVQKDKKAMNILFNGVDSDMFDNIIKCKTAKDVWDTIQVICDGTEQVRENKMQLLIKQYEHFHSEESESLTDIFS
ncbi:hypothetical protein AgCh_016352 [Apium graveolens]